MSRRTRKKNRQIARKDMLKEETVTGKVDASTEEKKATASENKENKVRELPKGGLIVYGAGDHLKDMLEWHKDLAGRIAIVIDKNELKIGKFLYGLSCKIENPEILKKFPMGTKIAISALRYYDEIKIELHKVNPGLICSDIDQAYSSLCQEESKGMLVYGVGAHLADMLDWHPKLRGNIARVFDKDEKRKGKKAPGTEKHIESPEALKCIAPGTRIAISAIRYYDEICREIYELNSGLVCLDIDEAYATMSVQKSVSIKSDMVKSTSVKSAPITMTSSAKPNNIDKSVAKVSAPAPVVRVKQELSEVQRQKIKGKDATERWRRKFLIECANMRKVFWGTKGVRANYLIQEFRAFMGREDFFIDDDVSLKGMIKAGLPVCLPEVLKDIEGKFKIIVLSHEYVKISEKLRSFGYIENVDFVEGRQILGEDENGYIDVPCIDKKQAGMIVYGEGAHLADMLKWHPELAWAISRVVDRDKKKVGNLVKNVGVSIEPIEVLKDLPAGTEIVVAAIKYIDDIKKDVHALQPGIICKNIDEVWREYV